MDATSQSWNSIINTSMSTVNKEWNKTNYKIIGIERALSLVKRCVLIRVRNFD